MGVAVLVLLEVETTSWTLLDSGVGEKCVGCFDDFW